MKFIVALLMVFWTFQNAEAHPGRTDANGCHTNHKTGDHHCHKNTTISISAPQPLGMDQYTRETCPVVGNLNSKIYHVPGGAFYERMLVKNSGADNRVCFKTEAEAKNSGYRRSKR